MILHPYIIATMAVALATIQGVGAFISSSGYNILQHQAGHQQHSLSSCELAASFQPPIIPHSSSSNEDEEEDEMDPVWESPYNHLFRSQSQHQQQHGITMNTAKAQQYQKRAMCTSYSSIQGFKQKAYTPSSTRDPDPMSSWPLNRTRIVNFLPRIWVGKT